MRNASRFVGFGLAAFLVAGGLACCSKPKPTPAAEVKPVEAPPPTPTPIPVAEAPYPPGRPWSNATNTPTTTT